MSFIQLKKSEYLSHVVYLVKCVIGVIICYILYKAIPQYPFYWSLVSVALATSLDSSNTQAYDRIKANIVGCGVGLCLYPIHVPELLLLCAGILMTVLLAIFFDVISTVRSALAGFIIVTLQVEQTRHWYIALERVVCVVIGCLVALLITIIFNWLKPKNMALKELVEK
jgi:uncharacterized membrane protein YccC